MPTIQKLLFTLLLTSYQINLLEGPKGQEDKLDTERPFIDQSIFLSQLTRGGKNERDCVLGCVCKPPTLINLLTCHVVIG